MGVSGSIQVDPIGVGHLDALLELCREHAEYEKADFKDDGQIERWRSALSGGQPPFHGWIATTGGQPCGFMTVTIDYATWSAERFAYMDCLYLRQPYRGVGLGRTFLDLLEQFAIEHRCGWAEWQTPPDNDLGIGFYRHMGVRAKAKLRFFLDVPTGTLP
jgi:ribosomal protein S18 acetylase RimI-like enzyme